MFQYRERESGERGNSELLLISSRNIFLRFIASSGGKFSEGRMQKRSYGAVCVLLTW